MIVKKCDICGAEMRMTTPRYKVVFDGWLYKSEQDICVSCFERIKAEIQTADTPQTEEKHAICNGCVYCDLPNAFHPCASCVDFSKYVGEVSGDTPQTDCNNCEHITEDGVTCAKYPACDDCPDNPLNKVKGSERLLKGKTEPQTETSTNSEKLQSGVELKTDCAWK